MKTITLNENNVSRLLRDEHVTLRKPAGTDCQIGDIVGVKEPFAIGAIECGETSMGCDELYLSQCLGENNIIPKETILTNDIGTDEDTQWEPAENMPESAIRIKLEVVKLEKMRGQLAPEDILVTLNILTEK